MGGAPKRVTGQMEMTGISHACSPIEIREKFAIPEAQAPEICERLKKELGFTEAVVLSTCNRVELYAAPAELQASGRLEIGVLNGAVSGERVHPDRCQGDGLSRYRDRRSGKGRARPADPANMRQT